jgi:hypothetical protein
MGALPPYLTFINLFILPASCVWRLSVLQPEAKPDGPGSRTFARNMPAMKAARDPVKCLLGSNRRHWGIAHPSRVPPHFQTAKL